MYIYESKDTLRYLTTGTFLWYLDIDENYINYYNLTLQALEDFSGDGYALNFPPLTETILTDIGTFKRVFLADSHDYYIDESSFGDKFQDVWDEYDDLTSIYGVYVHNDSIINYWGGQGYLTANYIIVIYHYSPDDTYIPIMFTA